MVDGWMDGCRQAGRQREASEWAGIQHLGFSRAIHVSMVFHAGATARHGMNI